MVEIVLPKEKWYQSRRIRGAALSLVAVALIFFAPEQYELIAGAAMVIASGLGIRSWTAPKE